MKYYHESRQWDKARWRMRAPILVGFFLHGGSPAKQPHHAGPICRRCGGPVLQAWSCLGRACAQCARPW